MANFDQAYQRTIVAHEGGYRNVSWDAGGETYRGITRKWFPNAGIWPFIDAKKQSGSIKLGTIWPELEYAVKSFYRFGLWNTMQGDKIVNQQLAEYIFDFIVQSGPDELKHVQTCTNNFVSTKLKVDGVFGPKTIAAINSVDASKIYNCLKQYREAYYASLLENGQISANDWNGIKNRLASFPWMEAAAGGGFIAVMLLLAFIINRSYYA